MKKTKLNLIFTSLVMFASFTITINAHATPTSTDPIPGLYNTGEGLSNGSVDTHFTLSSTSTASSSAYTTAGFTGFPFGYWLADSASANSHWITPSANVAQSYDPVTNGIYDYTTTFNLSGYNANTATFSGQFAADNSAIVLLNGKEIAFTNGSQSSNDYTSFSTWSSFSAPTGEGLFKSGLNTLTFEVTNFAQSSGNPTGLRAEFLSSSVAAVPEPEQWAMLMLGLPLIGWTMRRKQSLLTA